MNQSRKALIAGFQAFKRGTQSGEQASALAWLAMLDAKLSPPGTESTANRRSAAARTAALARHSKKKG